MYAHLYTCIHTVSMYLCKYSKDEYREDAICYQTIITTLLTSMVHIKIQIVLNNLYMNTHQYTCIHL